MAHYLGRETERTKVFMCQQHCWDAHVCCRRKGCNLAALIDCQIGWKGQGVMKVSVAGNGVKAMQGYSLETEAINFPITSLWWSRAEWGSSLCYLKGLTQLWSFPLFWKCKPAKRVWLCRGWCIEPCGAGLAKRCSPGCCSPSCVILEKALNSVVTAVMLGTLAAQECHHITLSHNHGLCSLLAIQDTPLWVKN